MHPLSPSLIAKILNIVLEEADNTFLYTVCRQILRFFCTEIDRIFLASKVPELLITWPMNSDADPNDGFFQLECTFDRLSDDSDTAYCCSNRVFNPAYWNQHHATGLDPNAWPIYENEGSIQS